MHSNKFANFLDSFCRLILLLMSEWKLHATRCRHQNSTQNDRKSRTKLHANVFKKIVLLYVRKTTTEKGSLQTPKTAKSKTFLIQQPTIVRQTNSNSSPNFSERFFSKRYLLCYYLCGCKPTLWTQNSYYQCSCSFFFFCSFSLRCFLVTFRMILLKSAFSPFHIIFFFKANDVQYLSLFEPKMYYCVNRSFHHLIVLSVRIFAFVSFPFFLFKPSSANRNRPEIHPHKSSYHLYTSSYTRMTIM